MRLSRPEKLSIGKFKSIGNKIGDIMELNTMSDNQLLVLFNSVKNEMIKRKSRIFVNLLHEYDNTNKDNFDLLNWYNLITYFKEMGYTEQEVDELLKDAKKRKILSYSIIPSRNYIKIQIFWQ